MKQSRDQYEQIDKRQSKYVETLKRREREENERNRKLREEQKHKKLLMSLQANLDNSTPPAPTEFVCGYFPKGGLTFIVASPGSGKTWLLLRIACDLSVGGSILDGFAEEEKPRKSLIFAGEAGSSILYQRVYRTHWNLNKENIVVLDSAYLENHGVILALDQENGRKDVEDYIAENKPDVVFFDTFGSFHSKSENKLDDMRQIIRFLTGLAQKYNVAIVVMHHTRKSSSRRKKNIGSSILTRNANLVIAIEAYSENDSDTSGMTAKEQSILEAEERAEAKVMVVKVVKTWYKDFNPFTFTLVDENVAVGADEEKTTRMIIDLSPVFTTETKETLKDILMEYIKKYYGYGAWFKANDIPEDFPGEGMMVSSRHVLRLLMEAIKDEELERRGFARNTMYALKNSSAENEASGMITEKQCLQMITENLDISTS